MSTKAETVLSKAIRGALEQCGYVVHRLQSGRVPVKRGWLHLEPKGTPDLLVLRRAKACYLEVKLPGEKPTEEQIAKHSELRDRTGCAVYVVTAPHEALACVREEFGK